MLRAFSLLLPVCVRIAAAAPFIRSSNVSRGEEQAPFSAPNFKVHSSHTPYGFWESPITPEWLVGQASPYEDTFVDPVTKEVYYTERRPTEGGRNILRNAETQDAVIDGLQWDARTRVHEYGGGHASAFNGTVYFSNLADNRVYLVRRGEEPRAVTPERPAWRFADFTVHPVHPRFVAAVREDHSRAAQGCVDNRIVLIDTETSYVLSAGFGPAEADSESRFGCEARWPPDFWDSPRFSPDGKHLVVRAWFHPYMSWEASVLWMADIALVHDPSRDGDVTLEVSNLRIVAGSERTIAVADANWVNSTHLVFTSDVDGYFNPWMYDLRAGTGRPIAKAMIREDFGEGGFWLGTSDVAVLDENHVIGMSFREGRSHLYVFRLSDGTYFDVDMGYAYIHHLHRVADGHAVFIGKTDTRPFELVRLSVDPRSAEPIHATYYPPANPNYNGGLPGELPPVVVHVHGGPTHFSPQGLSWETQLFTSKGFAWIDVNYGGSLMYGRAYRRVPSLDVSVERLLGKWGIVDVQDSIVAVQALGERGLIDSARAVIRGGSAGGFTTFAALATAPDVFAGGTSMFGVSDLRTLQAVIHKFESHYLLKYVGGTPETHPALWWERSPISKADSIRAPLLILQGANDTVVPVEQAVTMYETVKRNGVHSDLRVFDGEGHGWRQAKTVREALEKEVAWYQNILNGTYV
ncbi:Alpha/Beta hydrolase protein [Daedaleopsis nitida]|nr:Alpha/Beta hydrolase protein [Daedaleopsis nitida]